jgi:predicted transcriptional regulator YdeE
MQKTNTQLPEIKLVGITSRTRNISEMDQSTAKIGLTLQKYFQGGFAEKISNRTNPTTTYCVFTEYESDFNGEYTYFVGQQVASFDDLPEEFVALTIPAQNYTKFTNGPGPMPAVCIDVWKQVWVDSELDSRRNYIADFEIYDERASDHSKVVLDIYIGIKG